MPQSVIDAITDVYSTQKANVHRGVYTLSQHATDAYEQSRKRVAQFIGAKQEEVVFTSGTTESINLFVESWVRAHLTKGDAVVVTAMEHHANFVPWQRLCQQVGADFVIWPLDEQGNLDKTFAFPANAKVLAITHMSNTIGTINPIKKIAKRAKEQGVAVCVDGAQAMAHMRVDVKHLDVDMYCFSGHKLFGPTGIGVLYVREDLLNDMQPYQTGGGMVRVVGDESTTFADAPGRFEAGTPHIAGAIGLAAAVEFFASVKRDELTDHEQSLLAYAKEQLVAVEGVRLIGNPKDQGSIVSFVVDGIHPHDVGTVLDAEGVAIRTGHHCTQPLMRHFGVSATCRASFSLYNSKEDIDRLVAGIKKAKTILCP